MMGVVLVTVASSKGTKILPWRIPKPVMVSALMLDTQHPPQFALEADMIVIYEGLTARAFFSVRTDEINTTTKRSLVSAALRGTSGRLVPFESIDVAYSTGVEMGMTGLLRTAFPGEKGPLGEVLENALQVGGEYDLLVTFAYLFPSDKLEKWHSSVAQDPLAPKNVRLL